MGWFRKQRSAGTVLRWGRVLACLCLLGIVAGYAYDSFRDARGRDLRPGRAEQYLESVRAQGAGHTLPNIVLVVADDLGYGDLSVQGATSIKTPNIDQLAQQGVLFDNYYSPSPICSPSRAGMLSGRYPVRAHVPTVFLRTEKLSNRFVNQVMRAMNTYSYDMESIAHDEVLLPEVLKAAGYTTALLGKWHLGEREGDRPNDFGFDYFFGALYSNDMQPYAIYRNREIAIQAPADQSTLTGELTREALAFIDRNAAQPFFLYYASPFPHHPANASERFRGSSNAGIYGDAVQELDWSVGRIVADLQARGLDKNTLVLFTSDNGPWFQGSTGGLRGRKGNNLSGGQRVPFIAWMPERLRGGRTLDELASGLDIFPTVLELAGIAPPTDRVIDGRSLLPALEGSRDTSVDAEFVLLASKKPVGLVTADYAYLRATRSENSTYVMLSQGPFLFDARTDPAQSYDVTPLHPQAAAALAKRLDAWEAALRSNLRGWID